MFCNNIQLRTNFKQLIYISKIVLNTKIFELNVSKNKNSGKHTKL